MRAFIGIRPQDCLDDLVFVQQELQAQTKANYTAKDNIHLTLFFLGEISDQEIEKIKDLFRKFSFDGFLLEIDAITNFREMIIAKTKKNFQLDWLHKKLKDGLANQGFLMENRPYFAHITLARNIDVLYSKPVSLFTKVKSIILYSSERDDSGLRYRPLAVCNLHEKRREDN
ncbi:MAG: RNA 2',3'-cyclic phosphodiesterase [Bacilli bacterium]